VIVCTRGPWGTRGGAWGLGRVRACPTHRQIDGGAYGKQVNEMSNNQWRKHQPRGVVEERPFPKVANPYRLEVHRYCSSDPRHHDLPIQSSSLFTLPLTYIHRHISSSSPSPTTTSPALLPIRLLAGNRGLQKVVIRDLSF
jgi:hypothetical protein